MNIFLVSILALLISGNSNEVRMYKEAYNYLNQCEHLRKLDKKLCKNKLADEFPLNVFDKTYPLSPLIFKEKTIKEDIMPVLAPGQIDVIKFITNYDATYGFKPIVEKRFKKLFNKNEKSKIYIVFSKPNKNLLFAVVAYNLNGTSKVNNFLELTRLNRVLSVLFIFDKNGDIKDVKESVNNFD